MFSFPAYWALQATTPCAFASFSARLVSPPWVGIPKQLPPPHKAQMGKPATTTPNPCRLARDGGDKYGTINRLLYSKQKATSALV
ncbi:hypothetical protein CCHOA_10155 [Corynebacterium choanae]|uniref:Secreted protein n=1 Tax=Corynebacterium choanae TaxID=1862358 RepID=A0A3G6JE49_9CORY|nr:hypothetical protein CCHOA_10155 [Corynebacterium choanae]